MMLSGECIEEQIEIASQWKKLVDEIMYLEELRAETEYLAALQAGNDEATAGWLRDLLAVQNQKIRACESRLDLLTAICGQVSSGWPL